jgi:hypothetical protein
MPPQHLSGQMLSLGFGTEIIYSFVIIVCSLLIYFGTKELYELSKYKGIKYFREAFLFFAAAFFFRSFIKFLLMFFGTTPVHELIHPYMRIITLFIFMFASSMAIFYLLYSMMWKRWRNAPKLIYFYLLAAIISLASIIFNNTLIILGVYLLLLIFIVSIMLIAHKISRNKKSNMYIIYMLISLFLILNIIDILIPRFLQLYQLLIYLISLALFLLIFYKVTKKTG